MAKAFVSLEAIVHTEPAPAVELIKVALGRAGVIVTGATRFSNKALTFQLELEASHLLDLARELSLAVQLLEPGAQKLSELASTLAPSAEVIGTLYVTLVHGAPDERIELPKVPG